MVTSDGVAKLLDFGLAKLNDESSLTGVPSRFISHSTSQNHAGERPAEDALARTDLGDAGRKDGTVQTLPPRGDAKRRGSQPPNDGLTKDGEVIGTPLYMSPEMWRGHPATVLSDIYMLGTVLYELCCGSPPHSYGQERLLRQAVLHRNAVPVAQRAPGIDAQLAELIDRCISRSPSHRPQSAQALLKELEEIAARQVRPGGALVPKKGGKGVWVAGALALAAVAAAAVLLQRPVHGSAELTAPVSEPRPRVAVLGLDAPDDPTGRGHRFARAFAELLSAELAAGQNLLVLSGERVEHMKVELRLSDTPGFSLEALAAIRRNLGADRVVVGTLYRGAHADDGLRVEIAIHDTASGQRVATAQVRGVAADMFGMVTHAGRTLRQQLGVQELPHSERDGLRAARPSSPAVAELYAEGKARLRHFDPVSARKLFEQVVATDADFALGHLALAEALAALGQGNRARAETARAFELSARLRREDRYLIEARYYESKEDWPHAFALYQALQTFLPDNPDYGLYLAEAQIRSGALDAALQTVARLRQLLAPLSQDPRIELVEAQVQMERSRFTEATALLERAARRGEAIGAHLLRAKALSLQAWALINLGHHERARQMAAQARALYESTGDSFGVVDTLLAIGSAATAQGDYEQAQQVKQQTLDLLIELRDEALIATHLGNMANLLIQRGDLTLAAARAEAGLLLGRQTGNREASVQALVMLGYVAHLRGQLTVAERRFAQAAEELGTGGDPRNAAWIDWHMGQLRLSQGRLAESLVLHRQALAEREQLKLEGFIAESRMALALLAAEQGRLADAERLARGALAHFLRENRADSVAWAQALMCHVLTLSERVEEGEQARASAMERLSRSQNVVLRMRSLALLARHVPAQLEARARLLAALREAVAAARQHELVTDELELSLLLAAMAPLSGALAQDAGAVRGLVQRADTLGLHWIARHAALETQ